MTTSKPKFARHFTGRTNARLRAKIRSVAAAHLCGPETERRVLNLAHYVALTASGLAKLKLAAADYRAARDRSSSTCDCGDCYQANLQRLGANG